jgi:hypothetical protein
VLTHIVLFTFNCDVVVTVMIVPLGYAIWQSPLCMVQKSGSR